jgi:type II secretory pathway pseudopilin PulG
MKKKYFSLIELLIVIGILGALCTLILPGFGDAEEDAKEKVVLTEMREAQNAFRRFASDVMLKSNITKMDDILKYGLWPLMKESHPDSNSSITYSDYDAESGIGRRGPYLQMEGEITIADTLTAGGQAEETAGIEIPVLKDPYGGYYRVMCPVIDYENDTDSEKTNKLRRMVLVCSGPDRQLDTTNSNLEDNKIKAQGDDKVIRLMPLASY